MITKKSLAGNKEINTINLPLSPCDVSASFDLARVLGSRGFLFLDYVRNLTNPHITKNTFQNKSYSESFLYLFLCQKDKSWLKWLSVLLATCLIINGCIKPALAQQASTPQIDLSAISIIESNSNPSAIGDNGNSYGAFQIHRKGILADFNQVNGTNLTPKELLKLDISAHLAIWAFEERLPRLIKSVGKPVNERNLIIAWNCGVSCLNRKSLPKTTISYLKKYQAITKEKL